MEFIDMLSQLSDECPKNKESKDQDFVWMFPTNNVLSDRNEHIAGIGRRSPCGSTTLMINTKDFDVEQGEHEGYLTFKFKRK